MNASRAVPRYFHVPKSVHWKTALQTLQYVRGTSGLGIAFERGKYLQLNRFVDAYYANKATDRKLVSGGVVTCGGSAVK